MKKSIKDKGRDASKKAIAKGVDKAVCIIDKVPSAHPAVAAGKKVAKFAVRKASKLALKKSDAAVDMAVDKGEQVVKDKCADKKKKEKKKK